MPVDPETLRIRVAQLREKAAALSRAARGVSDPKVPDGYTALIIEYDVLALQFEQVADDFGSVRP